MGRYRVPRRENSLHEPHPLGGHADGLLMGLPTRVVHRRTTHRGHLRDGGQGHQPCPLELALDQFRHGFAEPQGVDQRLIGIPWRASPALRV